MGRPPLHLLIGVPTTLDGLVSAVRRRSDFCRRYAENPGSHWSREHGYRECVADPLLALKADVLRLGGSVAENATLSDVSAASRHEAVVILIGHWKGAHSQPADVIGAISSNAVKALQASNNPRLSRLGRKLGRVTTDPVKAASEINRCVDALQSDLLKAARRSRGETRFVVRPATASAEARAMLDAALGGEVAPGERLELADGLHDPHSIAAAVPSDFTGVLDFTSCHSVYLADRIDRLTAGRFRSVMFEQALPADVAALTLRQTLAHWKEQGVFGYLKARRDAVLEVASAMSQAIEAASSERD